LREGVTLEVKMATVRNDVRKPDGEESGLTWREKLLLVALVAFAIVLGLVVVGALR
jgi:hypothetical protein